MEITRNHKIAGKMTKDTVKQEDSEKTGVIVKILLLKLSLDIHLSAFDCSDENCAKLSCVDTIVCAVLVKPYVCI